MADTAPQELKLEFARRKRKRFYAFLLMIAVLVLLLALEEASLPPVIVGVLLSAAMVVLLGTFVYVLRVWRCPACNRFLGAQSTAYGPLQSIVSCPKCDARLV